MARVGFGIWVAVMALGACRQHEQPPKDFEKPAELVPPPTGAIGIAPCDDYLHRVTACVKLPAAARAALTAGAGAWSQAARHGGAAATAAEHACRDATEAAKAQLTELGC